MTETKKIDVRQDIRSIERLPWTAPKIVTMAAGGAENGAGSRSDNQVTFS